MARVSRTTVRRATAKPYWRRLLRDRIQGPNIHDSDWARIAHLHTPMTHRAAIHATNLLKHLFFAGESVLDKRIPGSYLGGVYPHRLSAYGKVEIDTYGPTLAL